MVKRSSITSNCLWPQLFRGTFGNQANDGNQTGRLSCLGCAGSDEGKEAWSSLGTNDFVPMAIRKCYSQGCPHAIHFTQCLSANCLEAGWIQIQHGLWVLGSYGANMAKAEITKVTHTREKREISDSVRAFCTRGKQTNTSRFKSAMTFTCQQIYQCRQHLYSNTAFLATKYSNN